MTAAAAQSLPYAEQSLPPLVINPVASNQPPPPLQLVNTRPTRSVTAHVTLDTPQQILGTSLAINALRRFITVAAEAANWGVLITGEPGTGKGLAAETIHRQSARRSRPFQAINCAAIPENMAEAELFGYRRGAFTGADRDHAGLIEQAEGGTLFLDELGTLSLGVQAKLLRAVETGVVRRLGTTTDIQVNIRIIAATSANLEKMMSEGTFRPDLYYRLSKLQFRMPALSERAEDIPELATHLARRAATELSTGRIEIEQGAIDALQSYPWPGNIRELDNRISAIIATAHFEGHQLITTSLVRDQLPATRPATPTKEPEETATAMRHHSPEMLRIEQGEDLKTLLARVEYDVLTHALGAHKNNKTHAAKALGIHRSNIGGRLRVLESMINDRRDQPIHVVLPH